MKKSKAYHRRILLVEDRVEDATLFKIVMGEVAPGAEVILFTSGDALLRFLEVPPIVRSGQVIFMDLNLPGPSGIDCLSIIKKHPVWREIPVVVLTSSVAPSDISRAYASYANSYIQKPLEVEDFRKLARTIGDYWLGAVTFSV